MKILKFYWDNYKGEDWNSRSLIIGQYLPNLQNDDITHLETYGISLDVVDENMDFRLKRHSCFQQNLDGEVTEITKEKARELLISEIDKALDILFNESEMKNVDEKLNTTFLDDEDDDEEEFM